MFLLLMSTPENILMLEIVFTIFREIINLLGNFNFVSNWKLDHITQNPSQIILGTKKKYSFLLLLMNPQKNNVNECES